MSSFALAQRPTPVPTTAPQRARRPALSATAAPYGSRLGAIDSPLEREADRIADAVLAGVPPPFSGAAPGPAIRRRCDACAEAEDEPAIRRRQSSDSPPELGAAAAASALAGGGEPLAPGLRSYFEPRFGRDFSRVRVHRGEAAASAARAIGARAYSFEHGIAFAKGAYEPATQDGRRLIAHELAHVVQQAPLIARQATPHRRRRFAERGGGGTTDFEETVVNAPTRTGDVIEGQVDRREIAPVAPGHAAEQEVSSSALIGSGSGARVRFDASACRMTLPHTFSFAEQATASPSICPDPPAAPGPLGAARVAEIGRRYMEAVTSGLNDQFSLRMTGCAEPCANRSIPITVDVGLSATPDTPINVVNLGGRGDSATICAATFNDAFARHEAGHQILRAGDEYQETDPALLAQRPQWGRTERVRSDLSVMGDGQYMAGARFHERHFRFAQVFLEAAFPHCTVNFEAPPPPRLVVSLGLDYARANGGNYGALSADIGAAFPLVSDRRLELLLGASGTLLLSASPSHRNAFLAGARIGLNIRPTAGVQIGLGARGGAIHLPEFSGAGASPLPARTAPFLEGSLGLGLSGSGAFAPFLRAEAGLGAEISNDPAALQFFRFGIAAGFNY